MRRRALLTTASACLLLALPVVAHAAPAPPGEATATAVQVGELVRVSDTSTQAGQDATGAHATVVEVAGQSVLGLGGSQDGEGHDSGHLVDTEPNAARLQVAPWETSVSSEDADTQDGATQDAEGETHAAQASSALTRAHVAGVTHVDVLESNSEATYTDEHSTGSAVSNGVDLTIADIARVVVLHSEVTSEGKGSSHLLGINDTEIGTDEQLGEVCALEADPAVSLSCLAASGGIGDNGEMAGEADAVTANSPIVETINPARVLAVSNASGPGTTPPAEPVVAPAIEEAGPEPTEERRAAAAPESAAGTLPRTGAVPAPLLWLALAGLGSGGTLWYAARRIREQRS